MRLFLLVFLILMAACQPAVIVQPVTVAPVIVTATPDTAWPTNTPAPTATLWVDAGCALVLGCGFEDVSRNPYLRNHTVSQVRRTATEGYTPQTVPAGYYPYNQLKTIDGLVGDEHGTRYAPIIYDGIGHKVTITGWAGETGWSQDVQVEPGCYIIKGLFTWEIDDPVFPGEHTYNYGVRGMAQRAGGQPFLFDRATFDRLSGEDDILLGVVYIGAPGALTVTWAASVAYATGGGWIRVDALAFGRDLDSDHCGEGTPGI
jgi:hypothetical protein